MWCNKKLNQRKILKAYLFIFAVFNFSRNSIDEVCVIKLVHKNGGTRMRSMTIEREAVKNCLMVESPCFARYKRVSHYVGTQCSDRHLKTKKLSKLLCFNKHAHFECSCKNSHIPLKYENRRILVSVPPDGVLIIASFHI